MEGVKFECFHVIKTKGAGKDEVKYMGTRSQGKDRYKGNLDSCSVQEGYG